tara:strand:- start:38494 stop:38772 length:279 start_codon:yes stop_codon:yes gene_type:complete
MSYVGAAFISLRSRIKSSVPVLRRYAGDEKDDEATEHMEGRRFVGSSHFMEVIRGYNRLEQALKLLLLGEGGGAHLNTAGRVCQTKRRAIRI